MLLKPMLALHIMNFSSCRNYWGGGAKRYVCHPNIFMGATAPPPPDRRLCLGKNDVVSCWHNWLAGIDEQPSITLYIRIKFVSLYVSIDDRWRQRILYMQSPLFCAALAFIWPKEVHALKDTGASIHGGGGGQKYEKYHKFRRKVAI